MQAYCRVLLFQVLGEGGGAGEGGSCHEEVEEVVKWKGGIQIIAKMLKNKIKKK